MRVLLGVQFQEDTDRVGALLILPHVFEVKLSRPSGFVLFRLLRVGDQVFPLLFLGKVIEKIDMS